MTPTPEERAEKLLPIANIFNDDIMDYRKDIAAAIREAEAAARAERLTRERIAAAVEGLFVNVMGQKATRLVLIDDKEKTIGSYGLGDLGGMCREAVVAHLCRELGVEE